MSDSDPNAPITELYIPVRLTYTVMAGRDTSAFLQSLMERRLVGRRSVTTGKVYVPPKGACPETGSACDEFVEVEQTGTVTTFCVVNIPFEGQALTPPYVCASVVLDGADVPLFHLVNAPPEGVRMGMRVRAVWRDDAHMEPTLESIEYFEPTGEPDAPYDTYKDHL